MAITGILKPLIYSPAKHIYNILFNKNYRTLSLLGARLGNVRRFTDCVVKMDDWSLSLPDSASFLSAYQEIFVEQIYAFQFGGPAPKILDLGANIGLSVLYFKQLYPQADITAFEADPRIFDYLKKNIHGNGFSDVKLINKAAWHENVTLQFRSEGADGGRAALAGDGNLVSVEAIDIGEFLHDRQFDFLKMDIEGAEEYVFPACKDYLAGFRFVFVEFHSKAGQKQCLDRIISILAEAGFRIHIHSLTYSRSPFMHVEVNAGFDQQLNIFGWRE